MSSNHLFSLLGRLEELITKSPRLAGRAFLPVDEALEIMNKIRVIVPDEVKAAQELVKQREALLRKTQEEANRILSRATKEAQRLLSEHHLIKLAQEESKAIKAQAFQVAQQMEKEANRNVYEILGRLEDNLLQALKVVHRSKEQYRSVGEEEGTAEENSD